MKKALINFFGKHKRIFFFVSVFVLSFCLSFTVFADELQSNGYDLHPLTGYLTMSIFTDSTNVQWNAVRPSDDSNIYEFENTAYNQIDQLTFSATTQNSQGFDVLINQTLYDYYFVVTVFADSATNSTFSFYPDYMSCQTYPCDVGSKWYAFMDVSSRHFDTQFSRGFTLIGRLNRTLTSSRITQISMSVRASELYYTIPANLKFSCSVIEVPKNTVTSTDIDRVVTAIQNQTVSINNTINNQTDYIINGNNDTQSIVDEFINTDDNLNSVIDDFREVEDAFIVDFNDNQSAILGDVRGWSWGGLQNCANWVGNTLTSYYNNMGDFKQYIIYPLMLGIALFFIGRGSSIIGHLYRKPFVTFTHTESRSVMRNGVRQTNTVTHRKGGKFRK